MDSVIAYSRELAILWKHGFIHDNHLFVAMLKQKCMASDYLTALDSNLWEEKVKALFPANGKVKGNIPLTIQAVRVLKHAYIIEQTTDKTLVNTVHLLLAILSYDNEMSKAFSVAGMVIEDITLPHFKKEIKRLPPLLKPIRDKPYTKMEIFFSAIGSKKKNLAHLHRNAVDLYYYHQYSDSIKSCDIALALSPGLATFRALLAYNKVKLKDYDAAIDLLTELARENPAETSYRLTLSNLYRITGNYDEVTRLLDDLLLEKPNNETYLNNRGFNLLRQQKYAEAAPYFEKAIKENADAPYPQNNLGFTKYKLGDTEDGLALIDRSLELDKGNSYAYHNKGIIFMEQGDKTEARKNFKLALKFGFTEKYDDEVERLLAELGVDEQI